MTMKVEVKINLNPYNGQKIIDLHKQGVITLDEIIDSGMAYKLFDDTLENYVNELRSQRRREQTVTKKIG